MGFKLTVPLNLESYTQKYIFKIKMLLETYTEAYSRFKKFCWIFKNIWWCIVNILIGKIPKYLSYEKLKWKAIFELFNVVGFFSPLMCIEFFLMKSLWLYQYVNNVICSIAYDSFSVIPLLPSLSRTISRINVYRNLEVLERKQQLCLL